VPTARPHRARLAILLVLGLAVAGGVMTGMPDRWLAPSRHGAARAAAPEAVPAATVSTILATTTDWQTRLRATGDVRAVQGADMSAEVSGIVDQIDFTSGQDVAAGTVLLRLRPNDDDARLAQLRAAADLAALNLARDQRQFNAQAVSRATLDLDTSTLREAQSQVAAQQAQMAEKVVRAPFAGRLGVRAVDVGQYLTAGTAIVTLEALDPIYVDFNIEQQALGQIAVGQGADVTVDAYPGRVFHATIEAINSRVDTASRMVLVRARLANHDHALTPGMFAIVEVAVGRKTPMVTLPQAAISYNPYGDLVYVVVSGKDGGLVAQSRFVQTGPARGDQVSVLSGVRSGEQVVTAGQLKLRNGSPVAINNSVQPSDSPDPVVQDE